MSEINHFQVKGKNFIIVREDELVIAIRKESIIRIEWKEPANPKDPKDLTIYTTQGKPVSGKVSIGMFEDILDWMEFKS